MAKFLWNLILPTMTLWLIWGCRGVNKVVFNVDDIKSFLMVNKADTLCLTKDIPAIAKIANVILKAERDSGKNDFKSYYFLYIEINDGWERLEVYNNRFRYNGKRYKVKVDIFELLNELCIIDGE